MKNLPRGDPLNPEEEDDDDDDDDEDEEVEAAEEGRTSKARTRHVSGETTAAAAATEDEARWSILQGVVAANSGPILATEVTVAASTATAGVPRGSSHTPGAIIRAGENHHRSIMMQKTQHTP